MDRAYDVENYLLRKGIHIKHRQGDEVNVPCFFHDEDSSKRGRLYVNVGANPDHAGLYMCHVCGAKGNLITLMKWFGDEPPKDEDEGPSPFVRNAIFNAAAEFYASNLGVDEFKWLRTERGLTPETIKRHQIGWAPNSGLLAHLKSKGFELDDILSTGLVVKKEEHVQADGVFVLDQKNVEVYDFLRNCITIPYHITGNVVQIRGRAMSGKAKYLTPKGQDAIPFNTDSTWNATDVVLTEGEFDALVVEQMGYASVGVPGAKNWQEGWNSYLSDARRVFVVFDNDKAGAEAAQKMKEIVGRRARIVEMPAGEDENGVPLPPGANDISEYFGRQGHSRDEFETLLMGVRSGILVSVDQAFEEWESLQGVGGLKFGYEKLDFLLEPGILPGQVIIPLAKTNTGKSSPVDSEVHTPRGIRRWGDLEVGDEVFGSNGKPTKITGVYDRGVLDSYRVTFSDGTSVLTGLDHIWTVEYRYGKRREWNRKNLTTQDLLDGPLKVGDTREWKYIIPMCDPVQYPEKRYSIDPYTLGSLIANGCMTTGTVRLSTPDQKVVDRIALSHEIKKHAADESVYCSRFGLPGLIGLIRNLGLDCYSHEKFIPRGYLVGSVEQRTALLQGLMDGDGGSSGHNGRAVQYFTTSRRLAEDMVELVNSLGGTAMPKWMNRGEKPRPECQINIMLPLSIEPFYSGRKKRGDGIYNTVPRRAIVSVEKEGVDEHRCISVAAADHLYLMGRNYIVTHNTIHILNTFQRMKMVKPDVKILFCSLEQTPADWFERARRIYSFYNMGVDLKNVNEMSLKYWRDSLYMTGVNRMSEEDLLAAVDDFTIEQGCKPDMVAIDYLGYWAQSFKASSRYEKVSDAVMALKAISKEIGVPVFSPHQVSRGAEYGSEPDLSDARDSGAIEETADFVFGMWNEDTRKGTNVDDRKGEVNLRIIKSRHGGKGHQITMQFGYCSLVMVPHEDRALTELAKDELAYAARGESWEDAITRHKTGRKTGDLLSFSP